MTKNKSNLLFHAEVNLGANSSYELYYIQAESKKEALEKLRKSYPNAITRKLDIRRVPKNEIISEIY
jgi:hypothetical protein